MPAAAITVPRNRKKKSPPAGLPSREAILAFIAEHPGKVGKREIARAFNTTGADRIGLKRLLRAMADDGQVNGRRSKLRRPGDLPSVTILRVDRIDDQGDLIAVPLEWDGKWGDAPVIVIATETGRKARRGQVPGVGDRVLARLAPDGENGGFRARIIKVLPRPPQTMLGVYREFDRQARIVPIDRTLRREINDYHHLIVNRERMGRERSHSMREDIEGLLQVVASEFEAAHD